MAEVIKGATDKRLGTFDFPAKVKPRLRDMWDTVRTAQEALNAAQANANSYALGVLDVLDVDRESLLVTMNMVAGNYVVTLPPGQPEQGASDDANGTTQAADDGRAANANDGAADSQRPGAGETATDAAQAGGQEKGAGEGGWQDNAEAAHAQAPESANGRERPAVDAGDKARGHLSIVE